MAFICATSHQAEAMVRFFEFLPSPLIPPAVVRFALEDGSPYDVSQINLINGLSEVHYHVRT